MAAENGAVKLLNFWVSPFGARCKIALAEKEVHYEYQVENLPEGKSELLLRSNPVHKKIPVLLHKDKPICESLNIVEYIDEAFPGKASFFPSDPYARANARFWADFIDKKVYPAVFRLWKLKKGEEIEEAKEFIELLRTIEAELGDKNYFGGEGLGFVDITLLPITSWFYLIEAFVGVKVEAECPKIAAWLKRCMEKDSVAKSLSDPKKLYERFSLKRKQLGVE